jgi:hypothetical protein
MAKSPKSDEPSTEIVQGNAPAAPADMDNLMTTVRTRVAGKLVITDGPGKGHALVFYEGSNSIGRDASRNVVALDFGDMAIHREPHAYLTCKSKACTLASAGKANPIKINGQVLTGAPEPVGPGDVIMIGQTTLRIDLA